MKQNKFNIIEASMQTGLVLGLYFVAKFFIASVSVYYPLLTTASFLLTLAVPFVVYFLLMNILKKNGNAGIIFSNVWTLTVLSILFASLIESIFMYAYLEYVNPGYLSDQINTVTTMLNQFNETQNNETLSKFIESYEKAEIPSAINISINSIFNNIFIVGLVCLPVCHYVSKKIKALTGNLQS